MDGFSGVATASSTAVPSNRASPVIENPVLELGPSLGSCIDGVCNTCGRELGHRQSLGLDTDNDMRSFASPSFKRRESASFVAGGTSRAVTGVLFFQHLYFGSRQKGKRHDRICKE